ncbi:MAG: hypothetical protein A3G18_04515 [Rhodospirillales bacterium RIFCSPLOWO2_12_FULL_58_28]|nr:MAG: hypothetical protein A3H92_09870 [Rhodospirillales bacterium RIFCSPLOWO2_02_FULL_58_16]OHC76908.1 MAG: hypothetical protein A3G18_04515 [Rhodospirillales bacterium RIFCSPLOWO2_12_FULL_58_28]
MVKKMRRRGYTVLRDGPRAVDIHVGRRVKERRVLLGLSQDDLGKLLGLTFQQVQKYEKGWNRISASKLWELTSILGVPVSWFFDGIDEKGQTEDKSIVKRETLQLVRYFDACPKATQESLVGLFRSVAGQ